MQLNRSVTSRHARHELILPDAISSLRIQERFLSETVRAFGTVSPLSALPVLPVAQLASSAVVIGHLHGYSNSLPSSNCTHAINPVTAAGMLCSVAKVIPGARLITTSAKRKRPFASPRADQEIHAGDIGE